MAGAICDLSPDCAPDQRDVMPAHLLNLSLFKRFFTSMREEGAAVALHKARVYAGILWRNRGRSSLFAPSGGALNRDHHYCNKIWQTLAQTEAFHVSAAPATHRRARKIALIADLNLPQCRKYRVEQAAEFWRAQGVEVTFSHYLDVPRSISALQDATHLMLYRLQSLPLTSMYMYEARRLKLPVLYDLDDPLFSVSAYETYQNMTALEPALKTHFLSEAPKYLDMMNGADIISVSTPGMAAHAREYTQRPVYVRRNFADTSTLSLGRANISATVREKADATAPFRVAFASGSHGHEMDFAVIEAAIVGFLAAGTNRFLTILGHFDKDLLPVALRNQVEMHPFADYPRYLELLAAVDCAVMPLADDQFNRCKSAVRVIDAASVAVPSIVGTVGDMAAMVRHGETGLIAKSSQDWRAALEKLAADRVAARRMGETARFDLETQWAGSPEPHIISPELLDWVRG
jgi:glycosyltransferase involved in cell wall biosynthesis